MPTAVGQRFRGTRGRAGYLLRQANQAVRGAIEREVRGLGITAAQYSLLSVLRHEPGLTITELASDSMLTQQTTSETVRSLTAGEYVRREPDPRDRRAQRLYLTDRGTEVLQVADRRVRALERQMTSGLSADERRVVVAWLVACAERFSD